MTIKADLIIPGYSRKSPLNSDYTGYLYFDTDKKNFYLDICNDETGEVITTMYLDEILNALCDIIR